MVNTLCIVQARLTSSRLPEKVLMELGGSRLSLLEHIDERLKMSKLINKVVFAIPDTSLNDKLAEFLDSRHIEYYRGSEDDVLQRFYRCAQLYSPRVVVRATCDNPCVDWELADFLIKNKENADYVCCKETALGTSVEVLTMKALADAYKYASAKDEREHVCPYIVRHAETYICKSLAYNKTNYRLTVDEKADLSLVNIIYNELYEGIPIRNQLIYNYLEKHPNLLEINSHVLQKSIECKKTPHEDVGDIV